MNYDTGITAVAGLPSRPSWNPEQVAHEMRIIRDDLHCNAVRISGQEVDRLRGASLAALQAGLDVWLSPLWPEATREEYLPFLARVAEMAQALPGAQESVVLVVGCEFTLFMKGLVAGSNGMERIVTVFNPLRRLIDTVRHGPLSRRLNRVLAAAAYTVRARFAGRVTYAAGTWEPVDWHRFDFVSVDAYRDRNTRRFFRATLAKPQRSGLPTVATELGCATYRGARNDGALAWTKADRKADRLREPLARDEEEQATEIADLLDLIEAAGYAGAFVFTFAAPAYPTRPEPERDLDLASYALVKTLETRNGDRYPDLPWEPKLAFDRLARRWAEKE